MKDQVAKCTMCKTSYSRPTVSIGRDAIRKPLTKAVSLGLKAYKTPPNEYQAHCFLQEELLQFINTVDSFSKYRTVFGSDFPLCTQTVSLEECMIGRIYQARTCGNRE